MPLKSRIPAVIASLESVENRIEEAAAAQVRDGAKARVPVDTGKLRGRIHVGEPQPEGTYVVGGDDEAWYGHLVEFGTSKVPPRPFLAPAGEENRAALESIAAAIVKGAV